MKSQTNIDHSNTQTMYNKSSAFQFVEFFQELRRKNPLFIHFAILYFFITIAYIGIMPFDTRTILGINPWIKPAKFVIAAAIYLVTMAWILDYLNLPNSVHKIISKTIAAMMLLEIVLISLQSVRGVPSHFNTSSALNIFIFSTMGIGIIINTIAVVAVIFLFFQNKWIKEELRIRPMFLWSLRLGLIIFIIGSIEGGYLSSQTGHTVGAPDGGPGIPLLNWSQVGGDLRIAHFLGLHAIQIIPVTGLLMEKYLRVKSTGPIFAFSTLYLGLVSFVFIQAFLGYPLF